MLRTWLLTRLLPAFLLLMMAEPASSRAPGDLLEGYVSPPVVLPVGRDLPYYTRPEYVPIQWPLIPDRFCSEAEKTAYLGQVDYLFQIANANVQLANTHLVNFRAAVADAERFAPAVDIVAAYQREVDQLERIAQYHSDVLQAWRPIRDRLKAMPVVNCATDVLLPEPEPPPPPPSSADMEGYFVDPIIGEPESLTLYYYLGGRPRFARINYPAIAVAFCSQAQKDAYLAEIAQVVAVATVNAQLARAYAGGLSRLGQDSNAQIAAAARAEAATARLFVDHYRTVEAAWRAILARMTALPVMDCVPPEDAGPATPKRTQDPKSSDFISYAPPRLPERLCSDAERYAFLANEYQPYVNLLAAELVETERRLAEIADFFKGAAFTDPADETVNQMRREGAQLHDRAAYLRGLLEEALALRPMIMRIPVVPCGSPADAKPEPPPAPGGYFSPDFNPLNLPRLPKQFCTEAERAAYLANTWKPFADTAAAEAKDAERRRDEMARLLLRTDQGSSLYALLQREFANLDHRAAYLRARADAARALRDEIMKIPVVPCPSPQTAAPPAPRDPAAFPRPDLTDVPMIDLPNRFCSEAERMAFLTDVYHPAAQAASRNAVEAARHLAELSRIIAEGPNDRYSAADIEAAQWAHTRYGPVAAYFREHAQRFYNLRRAILIIPVVNCEPLDADTPPVLAPPPPPPPPPLAAPPTAPCVRQLTDLEAGVIEELNLLRADPAAYADRLAGAVPGARRADVEAAATALRAASPAPPLEADPRLSGAAIRHADDIGPPGLMSHTGTDGSTLGARIRAQGLIASLTAEELSYGQSNPRAVVAQLVIDAGVAGAPHRRDLLNPVFRRVGVGCGPHKQHRKLCVITLSGPPVGS